MNNSFVYNSRCSNCNLYSLNYGFRVIYSVFELKIALLFEKKKEISKK